MSESLKDLIARRLAEIGKRRGGGPLTLKAAHDALPLDGNGNPPISYEIVRRASRGEHTNIGDKAADAIATMLDISSGEVLEAAGKRVRLGRFTLPRRADRLDNKERKVVLAVVDAILDAAEEKVGTGRGKLAEKSNVIDGGFGGPEPTMADDEAARDELGPSEGQRRRDEQDKDAEDEDE